MTAELVTEVDGDDVVVRYADPEHRAGHVSVWAHLRLGDTTHGAGGGRLGGTADRPAGRPARVPPRRRRPTWGPTRATPTSYRGRSVTTRGSRSRATARPSGSTSSRFRPSGHHLTLSRTAVGRIDTEIWSPADAAAEEPLPLLISHDGPEMDAYGGLTSYVGALVGDATPAAGCGSRWSRRAHATSGTPPTRRTDGRSTTAWSLR